MAMPNFTNQMSRVAIEARIAEWRRADINGNELTMRSDDDYCLPTAKAKELMKWLCRV